MQALFFDGALRLDPAAPEPRPGPDEALVRVAVAGICSTDLEITRGYSGFVGILGHEFVGEVVAGPDAAWLGQRVCGEINLGCGRCPECRSGMRSHCRERTVVGIRGRNGAFAEYLALPLANLHPIPPQLEDDEAVFVEPLAAAYQILEQIDLRSTDRVVVLGDGKLGLLCAQVLASTGADLLVMGKHRRKLEILTGMGIAAVELSPPAPTGVDVVIEATGSALGVQMAVDLARPRGTVVLKSTVAERASLDLAPIVVKELHVIGSRCGPFPRAIDALVHRRVQVRPLITYRFPLARAVEAVECAAEPGVLKVLVDMPGQQSSKGDGE